MSAHPEFCKVYGTGKVVSDTSTGRARIKNFDEAVPTLSILQAVEEASRCTTSHPCTYCDVCELMCPDLAITRDKNGQIQIDLDFCKGCGLCAHYCPKGAIKMVMDMS